MLNAIFGEHNFFLEPKVASTKEFLYLKILLFLSFKNTTAEIISSHCVHSSGVIFKPIQFDLSSARNGLVIACILRDLCDIFMMSLRCYFYLYYMYFYKSTSAYDCTEHIPPCQGKTFFVITLMAHDCHDICFNLRPFHIFFKSKRFVDAQNTSCFAIHLLITGIWGML